MHSSEILGALTHIARRSTRLACLLASCWAAGDCLAQANGAIASMLDAAEQAEREGRLIYPATGSAMSLYHEILFEDPHNDDALEGLTRIAEHYLEQAQTALDRGNLLKADTLVSQARMVYPEYPAVAAMSHQIHLVETADHHRQTLNWQQVADRSASLTPTLLRLGEKAKSGDCRVTINVSNDAEGRWIYQQMNRAPAEGRLRAEVKIGSPAAVDILCFAADETDSDAP